MTGYGRATQSQGDKTFSVEIRSLNSKYTDLRLKSPQNLREKETELRKIVMDFAQRGKLEMTIEVKSAQGDDQYGLNVSLFKRYYQTLHQLTEELGFQGEDMLTAILRLPNVVASEDGDLPDSEWEALLQTLNSALEKFQQFRATEGEALEVDLRARIEGILANLVQLPPFEEERKVRLRERLDRALEENMNRDRVDENRFEQEVLYYLEKIDINEEKVRLEQHCKHFVEVLDAKKPSSKGRKLSFIGQEIGREINTLGAKAYSSDIQRLVVGMKDELEKIKEQVANIV
ncbi:MAG: YicC family protein [Lewinella sp.]|nr:YicC family protein [Lewinella sp.]